jgi:hypothetical protein
MVFMTSTHAPIGAHLAAYDLVGKTEDDFTRIVAAHSPEFHAELTAAEMHTAVSKSLSAGAVDDDCAVAPAPSTPRRRRMGA